MAVSDIPFNGPISTVRVGRVEGDFVVNPTREQIENSDMEIVVSGNEKTIVMVEGEAELISEKEFIDAMKFAHGPIKEMIQLQKDLASQLEISKRPIPEDNVNTDFKNEVLSLVSEKVDNAIKIADKSDREIAISDLRKEAQEAFVDSHPESEKEIKRRLSIGIGLNISGRSDSAFAVLTNLLASCRSAGVARVTLPAEMDTPADRSGLVLVAIH